MKNGEFWYSNSVANDELKKRKEKLKEGIDKLKTLMLVAKNDREKMSLAKTIYGLEKKLELLKN